MKKYFADYVLMSPLSNPAFIENAELTVDELSGTVLSVSRKSRGKNKNGGSRAKCGFKTIIVPGFINAHIHTDLSFKPGKTTPRIFSEWVLAVAEKRKLLTPAGKTALRIKAFRESVKSGTTSIGDIIEPDSFYDMGGIIRKTKMAPRVKGFFELRGLDPSVSRQKAEGFKDFLKKNSAVFEKTKKYFSPGLSPHSVYSVSGALFRSLSKENVSLKLKTVIHAAEHYSETEFISGLGGDIADNLIPAFVSPKFSRPPFPFPSPVAYLGHLKILGGGTFLVHANEASDEDMDIIKASGTGIIHCPRSNAFFNSMRFPFEKAVKKGITVSLGTDGLYSNKSLSIIDELHYARKIHTTALSKDLFAAATVNGAKTLSFPSVTGTIEPGSYADFTVFSIGGNIRLDEGNIYDAVLSFKKTDVSGVAIGGKMVYDRRHEQSC